MAQTQRLAGLQSEIEHWDRLIVHNRKAIEAATRMVTERTRPSSQTHPCCFPAGGCLGFDRQTRPTGVSLACFLNDPSPKLTAPSSTPPCARSHGQRWSNLNGLRLRSKHQMASPWRPWRDLTVQLRPWLCCECGSKSVTCE